MSSASFVDEVNVDVQEIEFAPVDEEDEVEPPADQQAEQPRRRRRRRGRRRRRETSEEPAISADSDELDTMPRMNSPSIRKPNPT